MKSYIYVYFNWDIVALQYCVSFWSTVKWTSYVFTYIASLLDLPPTLLCPTHLGHHGALSWPSWALKLLPTSYLFTHSALVIKSCLTLVNPWTGGCSVHGISQASVLQWVAISCCRESSWPQDWTQVSCLAGRFFTSWASREAHFPHGRVCMEILISQFIPLPWYPASWSHIHYLHLGLYSCFASRFLCTIFLSSTYMH